MFISKIILENFRIFRGKHEFNFSDKKIIVVEGPNGHGKSTIFDAINWAISGKISRYVGSSEYQQFNYLINNDAFNNHLEATVEIHFSKDELTIKRTINKNGSSKLYINGILKKSLREGQKEIVKLLVNDDILNDKSLLNSIDLLSFIESTLILSQENLEEFVRGNKPTERFSKLEKVLGLTRYGQDFKEYLKELNKEYIAECNNLIHKKDVLVHKLELLKAEYLPKLEQSENKGIKSKDKILEELNMFIGNIDNYYSLKSFNHISQHNDISDKELNFLKKHIESIKENLKSLRLLEFELEKNKIYVNVIDSNEKILNFQNYLVGLNTKKSKRVRGLEQVYLIKKKLESISFTNKTLDLIGNEKEKIIQEIVKVTNLLEIICKNLGIKKDNINEEEISNFIKIYRQKMHYLNNLIDKNGILEKESQISILKTQAVELKEKEATSSNKVSELHNIINHIDKEIWDLNNLKKGSLVYQIDTIIHEVQTHLLNSKEQNCIVCGSSFNSSNELHESILLQIENSSIVVNEYEAKLNKYKVQKKKLVAELNEVKQKLEATQGELAVNKKEIALLEDKVVIMRLNNSVEIENPEQISIEIELLKNYEKDNENKYKGSLEITNKRDLLKSLKSKKAALFEEENKIIEKNSTYKFYVGNQSQLQLKLNKIESHIKNVKVKMKEYDQEEIELKQRIYEEEWKIEQLSKIKLNLERLIDCELELNSEQILNFIKENINLLEKEVFKANNLLIHIENYLGDDRLREIELKLKSYKQEISELQLKAHSYEKIVAELDCLIKHHSEVQGSLINEYLYSLSQTINSYFRQISPHSYFNYINLNAKGNELFILLKDHQLGPEDIKSDIDNSMNASLTLSAAQSTILAMSIFLALNKSQNWSKLSLIGIDDPFQNLDDINAYTFIDVISNLILVENRQIFISTHDSDFAKLTVNKMNLSPDDYAYIKIQSYTRQAIEIQSENYNSLC